VLGLRSDVKQAVKHYTSLPPAMLEELLWRGYVHHVIAKSGRSIRISERAEAASPRSRVGQACRTLDPTEHKYSTVAKVNRWLGSGSRRVQVWIS